MTSRLHIRQAGIRNTAANPSSYGANHRNIAGEKNTEANQRDTKPSKLAAQAAASGTNRAPELTNWANPAGDGGICEEVLVGRQQRSRGGEQRWRGKSRKGRDVCGAMYDIFGIFMAFLPVVNHP